MTAQKRTAKTSQRRVASKVVIDHSFAHFWGFLEHAYQNQVAIPLLDYQGFLAIDRMKRYVMFQVQRNVIWPDGKWRDSPFEAYFLTKNQIRQLFLKYYRLKAARESRYGVFSFRDIYSYMNPKKPHPSDPEARWLVSAVAYYDTSVAKPKSVEAELGKLRPLKAVGRAKLAQWFENMDDRFKSDNGKSKKAS